MPDELDPDEVEALSHHTVRSADLKLGHAAQTAAEDLVTQKLARLLTYMGAEPESIEFEWICVGKARGRKTSRMRDVITQVTRNALPPPPQCSVCGVTATTTRDVEFAPGLVEQQPRCDIHA